MFDILSDRILFPEMDGDWAHLRDARNWLAHHIGLYIQFPDTFLSFFLFPKLDKYLDALEKQIFSETDCLVREFIWVRYRRWVHREINAIMRLRVWGGIGGSAPFAKFWEMNE